MDLNITLKDLENKKLTDFKLALKDENCELELNVHKCVLYFKCEYFRAMIDFDPKSDFQEMLVDNAPIMRQVILSLYGISDDCDNYPEWYYVIEKMKCFKYLSMQFDVRELYKLQVPEENFDYLFYILNYYNPIKDKQLMKMFRLNFPPDFDLTGFQGKVSNDFLQKIVEKDIMLASTNNNSITVHDFKTGKRLLITTSYIYGKKIDFMFFSSDNLNIIYRGYRFIKILNIKTGNVRTIIDISPSSKTFFSPDKKHVAVVENGNIDVWNLDDKTCIKNIPTNTLDIRSLAFSNDGKYMVFGGSDEKVNMWDVGKGLFVKTVGKHWFTVTKVIFSNDYKYVYSASLDQSIMVWDVEKCICVKTIYEPIKAIRDMKLSNNNKYILIINIDNIIKLYDLEKDEFVHIFSFSCSFDKIVFCNDSKYIIFGETDQIKIWEISTKNFTRYICVGNEIKYLALSC